MIMNQVMNIINTLYSNPSTMNEIKNSINNEMNMIYHNFNFMNNANMINKTFIKITDIEKKTNIIGFSH